MKLLTNLGQLDEQNVDQLLTQAEEERKNQQELAKAQAAENEQRKREQLIKAQGPFIGPRGGKWADPAHTIPWVEGRSEGGIKKQLATAQADLKQTKAALNRAKQQGNPRMIKLFGDRVGNLEYAIEKMQTKLSGKPKVKPAEPKPKATTKKVPASQQKAIDALKQGGLKMSKLKAAGITKTQINSAVKAGLAWKGPDGAYRLTGKGKEQVSKSFSEESMDGIEMLQELTKAKYKRRWKGKDGKWQYEYDEPSEQKDKKQFTENERLERVGDEIMRTKVDTYFDEAKRASPKDQMKLYELASRAALRARDKFQEAGNTKKAETAFARAKEAKTQWDKAKEVTEKSLEKAQTMPSGNPKQGLGQGAEQGGKLAAVGKQSGPNDAKGGSPGASKPKGQVLSEDEEEDEANMKTHKKPIEKIRKSVPGGTTPTGQREMVAHQHAAHVSQLQKGEDDVRVGVGLRGPQNEPEALTEPKHWVGHANVIHFTNASDQATTNLLEKAHDNGLVIHTPNITRNSVLDKDSKHCQACRAALAKSLAQCPTCGTDQDMEVQDQRVQFQDNYRGQGLRPTIIPDLILPNGIANED